jgi:hypothetical protein
MGDPSISYGNITQLLAFLQYAEAFPDFPNNFTPPAWSDPSYVPPYLGTRVLVCAGITMPLALIAVLFRLWIRKTRHMKRWGPDDWMIIPATVKAQKGSLPMLTL